MIGGGKRHRLNSSCVDDDATVSRYNKSERDASEIVCKSLLFRSRATLFSPFLMVHTSLTTSLISVRTSTLPLLRGRATSGHISTLGPLCREFIADNARLRCTLIKRNAIERFFDEAYQRQPSSYPPLSIERFITILSSLSSLRFAIVRTIDDELCTPVENPWNPSTRYRRVWKTNESIRNRNGNETG